MKKLYIIRHGKSDWHQNKTDFERPLNKRGQRDAPNMGKYLKKHHNTPNLIVSSPANRAISTARLIANEVDYPLENIVEAPSIYEAPLSNILEIIHRLPNDKDVVYLFGHNPGLSMLSSYLTDENVNMTTCNVVIVTPQVDEWSNLVAGTCLLDTHLLPKELDL